MSAILGLMLISAGCATVEPIRSAGPIQRDHATPPPAVALGIAPPATQLNPPLFLDRVDRQQGAYVGFEQARVSQMYIRTDDRFRDGDRFGYGSRYERRAIIVDQATLVR